MNMTIRITKGEEYYIGTIKEIPAVITQGKTIDETKENLMDALQMYIESMQHSDEGLEVVMEEPLKIG